jgi:hypothetical protein
MDDYLQNKASVGSDFVISLTTNNALVFNQSATDVDNYGFNEKFSLTKTILFKAFILLLSLSSVW